MESFREICADCGKNKDISEFACKFKRVMRGAKRDVLVLRPAKMQISVCVCRDCFDNRAGPAGYALHMYLRVKTRSENEIEFTFDEFWEWLQNTQFRKLFAAYNKQGQNQALAPSVDRINNWDGYNLLNMQVINAGENASKGCRVSLGATEKTMKFFKRLRTKLGLTKYEMARHLGILPQTYFYYEEKAKGCSFEVLCLVKKRLGLGWNELMSLVEEEFGSMIKPVEPLLTKKRNKK